MQVGKYLELNQPIIYKTFINSIKEDKLSHAYLLVGDPGTPLKEVATYLAKSLVCDDPNPLACNNCISCIRIDHNNYPDFVVFDGSKESIKKGDIASIESQFERTAIERKGIMIYVIHLMENMTIEAVNSILKFLEEPRPNVYAFLTTNNENAILPTIISRCQTMHLKLIPHNRIIQEATEYGVAREDAELLSLFYNDAELILDYLKDDELSAPYHIAKEMALTLLTSLANGDDKEAIFYMETVVASKINKKESLRFFLDMLAHFFEDVVNIKNNNNITLSSYDTILRSLASNIKNVENGLLEIQKQRNLINLNINIPLQLDHLIFEIVKE
ncbi:MAG: hypothetical protein K5906_02330 [Bacilli bacterium]|nr:hypothetical protein [Bacilli bacterium]